MAAVLIPWMKTFISHTDNDTVCSALLSNGLVGSSSSLSCSDGKLATVHTGSLKLVTKIMSFNF